MKWSHAVLLAIIAALLLCCIKNCDKSDRKGCCMIPSCEIENCAPLTELYKPGELIITYPSIDSNSIALPVIPVDSVRKDLINLMTKDFPGIAERLNSNSEDPNLPRKCLCDRNVFIYSDSLIINHETEMAHATDGGLGPEGPRVSPNYWIQDSNDNPPTDFVNEILPIFSPREDVGFSTTLSSVSIGILDTGIEPTILHYSFKRNWRSPLDPCSPNQDQEGWNFIADDGNVEDDNGHGTLVAQSYLDGVSKLDDIPPIKILPIKVLDSCGRGTLYSVLCGIYYAHREEVDIANLSLGMDHSNVQMARAMSEVTCDDKLRLVCSSGNKGLNLTNRPHYPSAYARYDSSVPDDYGQNMFFVERNVFEVGGHCITYNEICGNTSNVIWNNSNYAEGMFLESSINYQEMVPGYTQDCSINGTSFAAPQFSAGLTYELSVQNSSDIKFRIKSNSRVIDDIRLNGQDNYYSYFTQNCTGD